MRESKKKSHTINNYVLVGILCEALEIENDHKRTIIRVNNIDENIKWLLDTNFH